MLHIYKFDIYIRDLKKQIKLLEIRLLLFILAITILLTLKYRPNIIDCFWIKKYKFKFTMKSIHIPLSSFWNDFTLIFSFCYWPRERIISPYPHPLIYQLIFYEQFFLIACAHVGCSYNLNCSCRFSRYSVSWWEFRHFW